MFLTPSKMLAVSVPTQALNKTAKNANEVNFTAVCSADFFISNSGILSLITNFQVLYMMQI